VAKGKSTSFAVVEMTGPDTRMDQFGNVDEPANALPVKCPHCTMPDLDFVAQPYLLAKGFAAPAEHSPAEVGNFLVRERTRKILDLVVPGQCTFVPTAEKKSKKATPWSLAVPKRIVDIPGLELHGAKGERCDRCKEPKLGWLGRKNRDGLPKADYAGADVFKTRQWYAGVVAEDRFAEINQWRKKDNEPLMTWAEYEKRFGTGEPPHPQRWTRQMLSRDLFFSVRLEQLFKKAKLKGQLIRYAGFDDVEASDEDRAWVDEKLHLLAEHGLVEGGKPAKGKPATSKPSKGKSAKADKWFEQFIEKHAAKKKPAKVDFDAIEKKYKVQLPQDYKDFITTVGPMSFEDVMEQEGFTASVLPPTELDFRHFRKGKMKGLVFDEDSLAIDGVFFAETEHGDGFVLDLEEQDAAGNYAVYWYDHEGNSMESFAGSFAKCIQRFANRT
jgi:hypothetical protein